MGSLRANSRRCPSPSGHTDTTKATFIFGHLQHPSLISGISRGNCCLDSVLEVFFKSRLFLGIGFGMARTRDEFAPSMAIQEAVDATDMNRMVHLSFKGVL